MAIDPMTLAMIGETIKDFLSKLSGPLPRGDFQKFKRTIYPHMAKKSQDTGKGVFAFWFGDVIRVGAGGSWGSVGRVSNIMQADLIFEERAEAEGVVYVLVCPSGVNFNSHDSISSGCSFRKISGSWWGKIIDAGGGLFNGDNGKVGPLDEDTNGKFTFPDGATPITSGLSFDTPLFAVVALVALFLILPRLGDPQ